MVQEGEESIDPMTKLLESHWLQHDSTPDVFSDSTALPGKGSFSAVDVAAHQAPWICGGQAALT